MENIKGKPVTNLTKGCFQHLLKLFSHHLQYKSSTRFASLFINHKWFTGRQILAFFHLQLLQLPALLLAPGFLAPSPPPLLLPCHPYQLWNVTSHSSIALRCDSISMRLNCWMNIFTHTLHTQNNCKLASPPSFSLPSHKTVIITHQPTICFHKTQDMASLPCSAVSCDRLSHKVTPASLPCQSGVTWFWWHTALQQCWLLPFIYKTIIEKQVNIAYTSLLRPHWILLPQTAAAMLPLNTISSHPAGRGATRSDCRLS